MQNYLMIILKGLAMGAADVVPGVSGGTVALITGIYERLLNALKNLTPYVLIVWRKNGFAAAWEKIDGYFLVSLALGIFVSIVGLAQVISFLLDSYTHLLWAFFFGLILVSTWLVAQQVTQWDGLCFFFLLFGTVLAFVITELSPTEITPTALVLFCSGAVAICAMILPGISGSFILLLLGMYGHIITAIKSFDLLVLSVFGAGCFLGLVGFSHILSWLFERYHGRMLALMTGFLLGSLNKVWPWKETLSTRLNSQNELVPLMQSNVLPELF